MTNLQITFSFQSKYVWQLIWWSCVSWITFFLFFLPAQWSSSSVRNHERYYGENLAVTLVDLLDLLPLSQGLPTSPSRCLDVWVNTLALRTHSFFSHHSFPPLHFSPKKINTRLPPQVARGGAAGMERRGGRRSVESLIYLSLSGPGRPQWVFMCVCLLGWRGGWGCRLVVVVWCVYNGCRERSVSPTLAPGLAQRKPLSVSLGRVCVCACVL